MFYKRSEQFEFLFEQSIKCKIVIVALTKTTNNNIKNLTWN